MTTEIIKLISVTHTVDAYGDTTVTETKRSVFAELASVGQKEFYQAQAVGLNPELRFKLQDYLDYNAEQYLEHNDVRYRVLRTYRNGQSIELTVYREVNPA